MLCWSQPYYNEKQPYIVFNAYIYEIWKNDINELICREEMET